MSPHIRKRIFHRKSAEENERKNKGLSSVSVLFFFILSLFITILFVPIRTRVFINIRPYEGEEIRKKDVTVRAYTIAGIEIPLNEDLYSYEFESFKSVGRIRTSFLFIRNERVFSMMPYSKIAASYGHIAYPGDNIRKSNVRTWLCYYNGKRKEISDFQPEGAARRIGTEKAYIKVKYEKYLDILEVRPVQIADVKASYQSNLHQYDALNLNGLKVVYSNGKTAEIPTDRIGYITDKEKATEKLGLNEVKVEYLGVPYTFDVKTIKNTNVSNALRDYADEFKNADYIHQTESCIVAVKKYQTSIGTYFLSHVIVNDPDQITGQLSFDNWGGIREKPSNAAERLNLVLATNASYFSYDTGNPSTSDVIIKDRKIYSDGETCGKEVCLMKDGSFYSPGSGLTAKDLLDMGVVTTWAAGDPLLIQEGKLLSTQHDWVNGKYPRTAIGMIKPCDYYVLTAGSGSYKGGLTFDDVQKIYDDLGCEYARTFDGGGSSTLVFDDGDGKKVLNNPAGNTERPVADIFGIRD